MFEKEQPDIDLKQLRKCTARGALGVCVVAARQSVAKRQRKADGHEAAAPHVCDVSKCRISRGTCSFGIIEA